MPSKRNRSIGGKFTPEEYREIAARAEQAGLSLAQYTRRELLASLGPSADARLLVGELLVFQEKMLQLAAAQNIATREQIQTIARAAEDARELLVADALQRRAKRRTAA
jgi:hypothetical protein